MLRQTDTVRQMVDALANSLYAEEMVCSMASQLRYFPETAQLNGLEETHGSLVPASYHRVTAVGTGYRILQGDNAPTLWNVIEYCIREAQKMDAATRVGLNKMLAAAPETYRGFVNQIIEFQKNKENYFQMAKTAYESIKGPVRL
ncbi:hypothetical protein [Bacillus testis]|uniref:hypothetical protein n=1 Tax=Bacillus testis TaxID=1622072 RepID=UPI000840FECD|nr:hypothetical protein [Bacillus testis]